jgi:hypothetical protein
MPSQLPHAAQLSGQKVELFTCAEKSSVFTADQVPVDPWDPRVMKINGKDLSTMPFHAWLCQQLADKTKALQKRSAPPAPCFVVPPSLLQQPHSCPCSTLRELDEPKFRESSKDKAARSITTQKVVPFAFEIRMLRTVILIISFSACGLAVSVVCDWLQKMPPLLMSFLRTLLLESTR